MRSDDMLRLGVETARLAVHGEDWEGLLAAGVRRILNADGGVGVITWQVHAEDDTPVLDRIHIVGSGIPPLAPDAAERAMAVASGHPAFASARLFQPHVERVSDYVRLEEFWDTDVWAAMHGHGDGSGRYPAAAEFGLHGDVVVFAAVHRRHRDLDAEDMEVLDELVRSPLVPALALLHAWDYAQRRLRRCLADQTHLLTPRETQVLSMVAAGHTNRRIGHRLGLSERTVRKHLENINDKLGTVNRAAAVDRWRGRLWNPPPVPAEVGDG